MWSLLDDSGYEKFNPHCYHKTARMTDPDEQAVALYVAEAILMGGALSSTTGACTYGLWGKHYDEVGTHEGIDVNSHGGTKSKGSFGNNVFSTVNGVVLNRTTTQNENNQSGSVDILVNYQGTQYVVTYMHMVDIQVDQGDTIWIGTHLGEKPEEAVGATANSLPIYTRK